MTAPEATTGEGGAPATEEQAAAAATPGRILRDARIAEGLTVEDVARIIRFSPRQVEALESDDYASLPGATAVRGFMRSYAKLLKLDPAPLLAELEPAVPVPSADVRPPTNMGEAETPSIAERVPPKMIGLAFALLVVALAAFWFLTRPESGNSGGSGSAAVTLVPPPATAPVPADPTVSPAGDKTVAGPPLQGAAPADAAAAMPSGGGVSPASAAAPSAGLHVEFDAHSWIEVRDASQSVVFVGEYPAGTRRDIAGKPPFQLWIGKASGVRVSMAGRPVDLKPHTREEVARLTVE